MRLPPVPPTSRFSGDPMLSLGHDQSASFSWQPDGCGFGRSRDPRFGPRPESMGCRNRRADTGERVGSSHRFGGAAAHPRSPESSTLWWSRWRTEASTTSWAGSLVRTVCRRDSCTQIAKAFLIRPTLWRRISPAARILRRITPMTNPAWPTTMARWMASCAPAPMMGTPSVTIRKRTSPSAARFAQNYLACDRYFASILGPTFPNRLFQRAAQTDRLDDSVTFSSLPTILDRLSEAGVSHRYFFTMSPSWRCGV